MANALIEPIHALYQPRNSTSLAAEAVRLGYYTLTEDFVNQVVMPTSVGYATFGRVNVTSRRPRAVLSNGSLSKK